MQNNNLLDDAFLIQGFNHREERSLAALFRSLYPPLCLYAYRILGDHATAEAIASTAFIKIWQRPGSFESLQGFRAYMFRAVRNAAVDHLRQQGRRERQEATLVLVTEATSRPVDEALVQAEIFRHLHTALDSLPVQCRKVIDMVYVGGMTMEKVAAKLGLSSGTVRTQKARGLALLRKKMGLAKICIFSLQYFFS
ncbi:MAG: sigma-70 family RNA polymerase sigma factor [Bacteroidetes bacterium]|nr:sigma-70 family RNA polymerase sigma factor [Bacteroidota bacterium]